MGMKKIYSILILPVLLISTGCILTGSTPNTSKTTPNNPPSTAPSTPVTTPTPSAPVVQVQTTATEVKTYSVNIQNFNFNPATLTIKKGSTVTWTNNDSAPHQIGSTIFNSSIFRKGQSYSYTFDISGTYDYICPLHPSMKGQITVE